MAYKIGKHLKDYKKQFETKVNQEGLSEEHNWESRWLPFIKYDHDFDGIFLIEIMVYKLHLMLDFYLDEKNCMQVNESRLDIVNSLKEACRLGDLIIADEFNNPAYDIMEKHMHTHFTPCEDKPGFSQFHMDWDSKEDEDEYHRLIEETDKIRQETLDKFFKHIRDHFEEWWD